MHLTVWFWRGMINYSSSLLLSLSSTYKNNGFSMPSFCFAWYRFLLYKSLGPEIISLISKKWKWMNLSLHLPSRNIIPEYHRGRNLNMCKKLNMFVYFLSILCTSCAILLLANWDSHLIQTSFVCISYHIKELMRAVSYNVQ